MGIAGSTEDRKPHDGTDALLLLVLHGRRAKSRFGTSTVTRRLSERLESSRSSAPCLFTHASRPPALSRRALFAQTTGSVWYCSQKTVFRTHDERSLRQSSTGESFRACPARGVLFTRSLANPRCSWALVSSPIAVPNIQESGVISQSENAHCSRERPHGNAWGGADADERSNIRMQRRFGRKIRGQGAHQGCAKRRGRMRESADHRMFHSFTVIHKTYSSFVFTESPGRMLATLQTPPDSRRPSTG